MIGIIDDVLKKIKGEIGGLTGLSIINIIFGAIALAVGVSTSVQQITQLRESAQIAAFPLIFLCIGLGIAVVGFFWIMSSVNILDFTTDIQLGLNKEKTAVPNENLTSLIVEMTAFYRKNSKKIKYTIIVTWIGGALFIGYSLFSVITTLLNETGPNWSAEPFRLVGIVLMLTLGVSCFFIPRFFVKFAYVWDKRLNEADEIQQKLTEKIGSS